MLTEDNDMISSLLRYYGEWGETSIQLIAPLIPTGGLAVDVGANIGAMSLAFARFVGPRGSVISFEAQRRVYYNLCTNLLLNNVLWVEAHHCLAGAQEELAHIALREIDDIDNNNINRGGISFLPNLQTPSVPTGKDRIAIHSLDTFLASRERCDLIKIDVEGAEPQVMAGLQQTLGRKRPYLYVECGSAQLFNELVPLFANAKYDLYWHPSLHFNPENFRKASNITNYQGDMNLLGVPNEKLSCAENRVWEPLHKAVSWQQVDKLFPNFKF